MMKERFAKLLLGEDMSGSGQGVSPALTISNAITNLCGTNIYSNSLPLPLPSLALISSSNFMCSFSVWTTMEIGAIDFGKEIAVAKRDGMASLCD